MNVVARTCDRDYGPRERRRLLARLARYEFVITVIDAATAPAAQDGGASRALRILVLARGPRWHQMLGIAASGAVTVQDVNGNLLLMHLPQKEATLASRWTKWRTKSSRGSPRCSAESLSTESRCREKLCQHLHRA